MVAKKAPSPAHAAREARKDAGFTVADGRFKAMPHDYLIVGGSGPRDLPAERLLALYGEDTLDHRRARSIILGARDRLRVAQPPPASFVDSCRNGLTQDVGVADLRVGSDGEHRMVVLVGRQRIMARRIIDAENAKRKPPEPALYVFCVTQSFPRDKAFDVELAALEANCKSNCFVAEPPSVVADKAAMLDAKGMPHGDIAVRIGASGGAEHVGFLVALAGCEPAVWRAVDAMKVPLSQAPIYRGLAPEEQTRRAERAMAGSRKKDKDAAADTRPKVRLGKTLASLEAEVLASLPGEADDTGTVSALHGFAAGLAFARGLAAPAWAQKYVDSATAVRRGNGTKP